MIIIDNFIEIHKDHIRVREATKQGYAIGIDGDSINFEQPNSKTRRGRIGHQIAQTLTCSCNQGIILNKINNEGGNLIMKEFTNNFTKYNFKMDTIRLFDSFAGIGALHQSLNELGVPTKIIGLSETDIDAIISYAGIHIDNFKNLEFSYPSEDEMRQLLTGRNIGWDFMKEKSCIPRLKKDKLYKVYKATILLNNLGDVSKLDYNNLPDFDLFNMSFPCTDLSNAGQQKGLKNEDGTTTRSGLVKYGIEVIKAKKPKYIMIENVKALIQKKFIEDFNDIVSEIESYGYKCYFPIKDNGQPTCLNAKNYGIAQNRERIFVICVRNDMEDELFEFPKGFDNGLRLKDFLEDEVDEKYYLSQEIQERFKLNGKEDINRNELNQVGTTGEDKTIGQRDRTYGVNGIIPNLTATDYKQPKQILTGAIRGRYNEDNKVEQQLELRDDEIINTLTTVQKDNVVITEGRINSSQDGVVINSDGISPTHTAGHGNCPKIIEDANKLKFVGGINDKDWVGDGKELSRNFPQGNRVYDSEGIACSQTAQGGGIGSYTGLYKENTNFRIRKLTPKECWRLMGFRDECFDRAKELGISDSALYKQAGNSIVVNCLYYIFKELFKKYIIE